MTALFQALGTGLPLLAWHLLLAIALLGIGVAILTIITPWNEMELIRADNMAAAIVLAGNIIALALPIAATLAVSSAALDIAVWGAVGLILQLLVFFAATLVFRDLRQRIEEGKSATAVLLAAWQIALGLINAAALAG